MIWSSRDRNRSCSPVSRRSRGFMAPQSTRLRPRESRIQFARNHHSGPHLLAKSITSSRPFQTHNQRLRKSSRTTKTRGQRDRGRKCHTPLTLAYHHCCPYREPHPVASEHESVDAVRDEGCLQTDLVGAGRPIPLEVGA